MAIRVYTDGATSSTENGGQGLSGWGYVALVNGKEYHRNCGYKSSTSDRMELMAVIYAIKDLYEYGFLNVGESIDIYTDSRENIKCFEKAQAWLKEDKKDLDNLNNLDLVIEFFYLYKLFNIKMHKVIGHGNDYYNNIADNLAVRARTYPREFLLDDLP